MWVDRLVAKLDRQIRNAAPSVDDRSTGVLTTQKRIRRTGIDTRRARPATVGLSRFCLVELDVDPSAWFFAAHFYQDPVIPGSLGLESFLQIVQVLATERWGAPARFQAVVPGHEHRWTYRGQVIPKDSRVTVQAAVTKVDEATRTLTCDGWLTVDGRVISQMQDFTLQAIR